MILWFYEMILFKYILTRASVLKSLAYLELPFEEGGNTHKKSYLHV